MKHLLSILILTCATACLGQSVSLVGSGASVVGTPTSFAGIAVGVTKYCGGRFSVWDNNTNVVIDNTSDLTWTRNASLTNLAWQAAIDYCSNLTHAGYSDWRLPSVTELSRDGTYGATNGLVDAYPSANNPALPLGHPFINVQITGDAFYWSSTTNPAFSNVSWRIYMPNGYVSDDYHTAPLFVWPCRGP